MLSIITPLSHIVLPRNGHFLALVADEFDAPANIRRNHSLETALAKQRVNRLDAIPTFRKELDVVKSKS